MSDAGSVLSLQNYDPYGNPESGTSPATFGYTGELQDGWDHQRRVPASTLVPAGDGDAAGREPGAGQYGPGVLVCGREPGGWGGPFRPGGSRRVLGLHPLPPPYALGTADDGILCTDIAKNDLRSAVRSSLNALGTGGNDVTNAAPIEKPAGLYGQQLRHPRPDLLPRRHAGADGPRSGRHRGSQGQRYGAGGASCYRHGRHDPARATRRLPASPRRSGRCYTAPNTH